MKTKTNFWNVMLASSFAITALVALPSCDKDDDDNNGVYTVNGSANGTQMVPTVSGTGTATFTGTYDPNTRIMTYNTGWTGLSGAPTKAGFYNGASGTSGSAVGTEWTLGSGLTSTGTASGTMTLTSDQANQLVNGNWYYSYGTGNNPNGEVRGQITAAR